ncbi:hypothetical protein DPMN_179778 [Dreissena polymorpha]|uniref:Uncharacterized protein n=1 Tax=Dreissena polymorpha TaxID=45954 RepID=A0A9D4INT9_DREPO|nr:hypothetical protein DPMN_179778 [Dreissena polymorpha]
MRYICEIARGSPICPFNHSSARKLGDLQYGPFTSPLRDISALKYAPFTSHLRDSSGLFNMLISLKYRLMRYICEIARGSPICPFNHSSARKLGDLQYGPFTSPLLDISALKFAPFTYPLRDS